jgi:hypothetical protein
MTHGRPTVSFLTLVVVVISGCASLTEPPSAHVGAPATARPAAPTPPPTPPAPVAQQAPSGELVAASHILVAYSGATRANPAITRSKDEAKKVAEGVQARAAKGEDFAKLADDNSDDPSAKRNHGSLGKFTRDQMVKPFSDAAFALKPGQVSNVVETNFGFHVIKRTE